MKMCQTPTAHVQVSNPSSFKDRSVITTLGGRQIGCMNPSIFFLRGKFGFLHNKSLIIGIYQSLTYISLRTRDQMEAERAPQVLRIDHDDTISLSGDEEYLH